MAALGWPLPFAYVRFVVAACGHYVEEILVSQDIGRHDRTFILGECPFLVLEQFPPNTVYKKHVLIEPFPDVFCEKSGRV
jgi:hypothetical protein